VHLSVSELRKLQNARFNDKNFSSLFTSHFPLGSPSSSVRSIPFLSINMISPFVLPFYPDLRFGLALKYQKLSTKLYGVTFQKPTMFKELQSFLIEFPTTSAAPFPWSDNSSRLFRTASICGRLKTSSECFREGLHNNTQKMATFRRVVLRCLVGIMQQPR